MLRSISVKIPQTPISIHTLNIYKQISRTHDKQRKQSLLFIDFVSWFQINSHSYYPSTLWYSIALSGISVKIRKSSINNTQPLINLSFILKDFRVSYFMHQKSNCTTLFFIQIDDKLYELWNIYFIAKPIMLTF